MTATTTANTATPAKTPTDAIKTPATKDGACATDKSGSACSTDKSADVKKAS